MFKLYYPVKNPINSQNLFGANPAQYKPLGQIGHPGNDFECPIGTPVYAPCDGYAFYATDKLGGDGIYIRTLGKDYNIILWHMMPYGTPGYPYAIPQSQFITTPVKGGELLGYSGNSGFPRESTGPHLHLAVMPLNSLLSAASPQNGYMGCINPMPFYNGAYAEDIGKPVSVEPSIQATINLITEVNQSPIPQQEKNGFYTKIQGIFDKIKSLIQGRNN